MQWLTASVAALALAVAIASAWYTKGQRDEARRANAREEAEVARQSAVRAAEIDAARFRWSAQRSGQTVLIVNEGTEIAHDIYVSPDGIVDLHYPDHRSNPRDNSPRSAGSLYLEELHPGNALRFQGITGAHIGGGHSCTIWWAESDKPAVVPVPLAAPQPKPQQRRRSSRGDFL